MNERQISLVIPCWSEKAFSAPPFLQFDMPSKLWM